MDRIIISTLMADPEAEDMQPHLYPCVTMTIRFGIDQVLETCERIHEQKRAGGPSPCDA